MGNNLNNICCGVFGSGIVGNGRIIGSFCALHGCLKGYVPSRHLFDNFVVCNVFPAFKVCNVCISVNHLGKLNAYGQESANNNTAVLIYKCSAVNVLYVNANIEAGGYVRTVGKNHIQSLVNVLCNLLLAVAYSGYTVAYKIQYLHQSFFNNYLSIKGNALCKYELGVACVEVHQAVISNNCTESGSQQTVSNLNSVCFNTIVDSLCVFYLINYCVVEVCKRIGRSCCVLKQVLNVEVIAEYFSELIDNFVNGVIKIAVNLCGQTIGDLSANNFFKLFYKCFKGRNVCECMDKVLCIESVGDIIPTGYSLNVSEENLCIARCESLVVYSAEESGIYCIKYCNDLFQSQTFCKRDEIVGICCVNTEDLILEGVHCGICGICHLFESNAENACKLGRNVDVGNQLAVRETKCTNLTNQNGKLCSCTTNKIYTGLKNKVEVDNLCLDFSIFCSACIVGNFKGCTKQLAAFIDVCQLGQSGNEIGQTIQQACGIELGHSTHTGINAGGDSSTVNLNFGNGIRQRTVNAERLYDVGVEIKHAQKFLSNAGFIDNLDKFLNLNLINKLTNGDSLKKGNNVNDLGNFAVLDDVLGNILNAKSNDEILVVGLIYKLDKSHVAAGDSSNDSVYALFFNNGINCNGIFNLETFKNVCRENSAGVETCYNLVDNSSNISQVRVAVFSYQFVNQDNVCNNQISDYKLAVIDHLGNVYVIHSVNILGQNVLKVCLVVGEVLLQRGIVYIVVRQISIANSSLEEIQIESILELNTVELDGIVDANETKQSALLQAQSQIHQLFGVLFNKFSGIDVLNSYLDLVLGNVLQHDIDGAILNVGLQVHILKQTLETFGIYASKQFVCIKASKKRFCIDISDNRFCKSNDLFLGNDSKEFFLSHNIAETTICRDAFEQSLDVSVLNVGQKSLGINGNGNIGRRYVFFRCLVCFHAQPSISKRTDRQNSQNSYEC